MEEVDRVTGELTAEEQKSQNTFERIIWVCCISELARGDLSGGGTFHSITDEAGGIGHLKKEIALKYLPCWNYNPVQSYLRAIPLLHTK